MAENRKQFDGDGFYKSLESTMLSRGISWKQVAAETGVSASTLSRMSQGKLPDAASLAALAAWSSLNPADYVNRGENEFRTAEPLAMISNFIHSDPNLSKEGQLALDELVKAAYQRLVASK